MKHLLFRHIRYIFAALLLTLTAGCGKESELIANEAASFASYITKAYPEEPLFDVIDGVYRYRIRNNNNFNDPTEIVQGDNVGLDFAIYSYAVSSSTIGGLLYTNVEELLLAAISQNGELLYPDFDPSLLWDFTELSVNVGRGEVLKGLDIALPGCIYGDQMLFMIPSRHAYGGRYMGHIPQDSAIVIEAVITRIN